MNDKIKLKDACKILNGFAFKSNKYVDSGIRIIRIANVQKGYVEDERPAFYPNSEESTIRDYMLEEDDLLLSLTGNVGRVALLDKRWLPAALNQRVACLRIKGDRIIKYYLYFALLSDKFEKDCIESSKGIAQKNMSTEWLKDYEIPLPSVQKQREIVSLLKQLSMIIKNKTEQIQQLDDLIKARFVEMFGMREKWNDANWKIASIDEIIKKPKSGEWGQKDESGRGIGVIRTTNFSNSGAVYFNSITTRDIPREKLITKGIKNGDILIEKSGGSDKKPVGRVVLYTGESNKYLNNNFTAILRINNNTEVNNIFLFTFLYINYWQGGTKVFESKTTGIHNLNLKEFLNKTKIALPDMSLQNQFATFVTQVDKSKFALVESIKLIKKSPFDMLLGLL